MQLPVFLVIAHFVSDFLLQNDWMALNKSKDLRALLAHVGVYTLSMVVFLLGYMAWTISGVTTDLVLISRVIQFFGLAICSFAFLTFGSHLLTDAVTSRVNSKLWFFRKVSAPEGFTDYYLPIEGLRHWFFVAIGFDQLLHYVTLAWTWRLVFGG